MMMMMLSQDEIDSLLSNLSVASPSKGAAAPAIGVGASTPMGGTGGVSANIADILSAEKEKNYKIYNFRRPDKFSKDTLRALEALHEMFSRNLGLLLASFLRTVVTVDVISVDQVTYDEFVKSMPRPITAGVIELAGLKNQQLLGLSHEITMSILDRMLGGMGNVGNKPRELSDIEVNIMKKTYGRMLEILSEAWRVIVPNCSGKLKGIEESYTSLQITSTGEIVAVVTFEVTIGAQDSGLMSLCLPFPSVEPVMEFISTQNLFSGQLADDEVQTYQSEEILRSVNFANMPLSVLLGGCQLNVQQLLSLKVGDVLKLDRLAGQDLLVCVNQKPKFFANPGTLHGHLAACINDTVKEPQSLKGFGLSEGGETHT